MNEKKISKTNELIAAKHISHTGYPAVNTEFNITPVSTFYYETSAKPETLFEQNKLTFKTKNHEFPL